VIPVAYTRYELLRIFRNKRFFLFSVAFPVILYFLIATPNRDQADFLDSGMPLYYMIGLAAFGTMTAVLAGGGRIANERSIGWTRQLRITPLSPRAYIRAKIVTGYLTALVSIALLYAAGIALGVRLGFTDWLVMTGLILVALIPFAALGIFLGHVLSVESVGPAIGVATGILAFLGGSWFPLGNDGVLYEIGRLLPSYWLVQAARSSTGGGGWGATGWVVVGAWSVVLIALATRAYRRDTARG
jgi:ABC-2 type transport system permease protein